MTNSPYSKGVFEKLKPAEKNTLRNALQALIGDIHWAKPREKKVLTKILNAFSCDPKKHP